MLQATRLRLYAFVVFLGLLLAFTAPSVAQQLSPAQAVTLEQDADRLADLLVEQRSLFLGQNTMLDEAGRRARSAEIDRAINTLRAAWRGRSPAWETQLVQRAEVLAEPRHAAERARYAPAAEPEPPAPSGMENALDSIRDTVSGFLSRLGEYGFMIALAVFIGVPAWLLLRPKKVPSKETPPLSDNYGTARYADMRTMMPDFFYAVRGVFFGKSSAPELDKVPVNEQPGAPILSTPEHHTLIVARTRTGKGTRVIVPTLLRYAGSAIVIDPKGENAAITARVRVGMLNKDVHIINPWGELAETFKERGLAPATFMRSRAGNRPHSSSATGSAMPKMPRAPRACSSRSRPTAAKPKGSGRRGGRANRPRDRQSRRLAFLATRTGPVTEEKGCHRTRGRRAHWRGAPWPVPCAQGRGSRSGISSSGWQRADRRVRRL